MVLAITTVVDSISQLSIEGVQVCDFSNIPPSALRLTPLLIPIPGAAVTNFTASRKSFGGGSSALADAEYDLNYYFLYCEAGSGRSGLDYEEDRWKKVQAIIDEIMEIDTITGAVDVWPAGNVTFTTLQDPAGNQFLGCQLVFHVQEFWR